MFHCYMYFEDPTAVGKYSQLVEQIHKAIETKKVLVYEQLSKLNPDATNILITSKNLFSVAKEKLSSFDLAVVVGDQDKKESDQLVFIPQKLIITQLRTLLNDFMKKKLGTQEYVPLSIKLFRPEIAYPCDLYIKLNNQKYLKIGKANAQMDEKVLQKLIFKGSKYLYLNKEDYNTLVDFVKPKVAPSEQENEADADAKAVETVQEYILDMGVDKKIINMTRTLQSNIEEKFNQKFMRALLQRFKTMEGSFLHNHSFLTATIALSVGQKFTWMNYENKEKIFLASILHDLGHKDKDHAKFEGLSKTGLETLEDDVREAILKHPTIFAQKLAQVPDIHQDVLKIVKDHHGVKGDNSYPSQVYPNEINLIFALFILSHEFAIKLYSIAFNPEKIGKILEQIIEEFDKGNYKKILPEFKETVEQTFTFMS